MSVIEDVRGIDGSIHAQFRGASYEVVREAYNALLRMSIDKSYRVTVHCEVVGEEE